MKPILKHPWNLSETEALTLQQQLAAQVIKTDQLRTVNYIAGVDVAYPDSGDRLVAAVVILDADTLEVIETQTAEDEVHFPYIPGLFSFRELPPLLKAFEKVQQTPDLILCDGQGLAHPRRFGLACHLGMLFDVPTIGCGKTRLTGEHEQPAPERGASAPLIDQNEVIGCVLRTQTNINPVYVSVGHKISLETACKWVLKAAPKYRLPETTRQADHLVNTLRKALGNK
ncbi:Endonuclease V [Vibrio aerogenes CECT 7868]|uniref:Endonuclease V n=1 Tax=Vibrio aerogenes CECT 7868 TaxID=1216006 RepID=A0A1M5ZQA4_9VIBR|nr:deoxyribonuclease V [Vibrio aerogenes]SHI26123.1 Endonuclease V [Vibrio aerogenes CECT 7868]